MNRRRNMAPTPDIEAALRQVRCPACSSESGDRCITASGTIAAYAHMARFEAARHAQVIHPEEHRDGRFYA